MLTADLPLPLLSSKSSPPVSPSSQTPSATSPSFLSPCPVDQKDLLLQPPPLLILLFDPTLSGFLWNTKHIEQKSCKGQVTYRSRPIKIAPLNRDAESQRAYTDKCFTDSKRAQTVKLLITMEK